MEKEHDLFRSNIVCFYRLEAIATGRPLLLETKKKDKEDRSNANIYVLILSFPKSLGTKSLVRVLLQGSFPRRL